MSKKDSKARAKALQLLTDLAEMVSSTLVEATNMDKDSAAYVGQEAANHVARQFGKQLIYIPAGLSILVSNRNADIWAEFNGNNQVELAAKYGLSLQWVYTVIKGQRAADLAIRQPDLFPPKPPAKP